jgi:4,5-dihydroxyphthalate decarboxylase
LQHELDVDLSKITFVLSGDEHVEEYKAPPNVVPIEKGKKMEDMLIAGELAAAIGVSVEHPDVKTLVPNPREAGYAALKSRGLYPINHTVVIKDELIAAHPGLATDVFNAFAESKRLYVEKLRAGQIAEPTRIDQLYLRVMEITGKDPLPYGIDSNRAMVEEVIKYAAEQKILPRRFAPEEIFVPETHRLDA